MTVRDIYRLIRGTKENNYSDGVLATTQAGAVTLARTIINGVANNARVETIKENSDVIDGVKFLGTLDGKTCPYCASLDGYIWRGEEMGQARRPPIHPNCRCTLIPYVELKDDEGNIVEVDSERPAANADFDQLAKEAYNDNARQNGWQRRWDDLAPSTRLKYYYQAQKDFEAQTGKKAYEQVPASLTFADYFKKQDNDFKRSWLGAKRFELYKDGKLKEDQIFAPNLGYMATAKELFHISKETQQTADELAEIAKEQGEKIKQEIDAQKGKKDVGNSQNEETKPTAQYQWVEITWDSKLLGKRFGENDSISEQDFVQYDEKTLLDVLFKELPAFYYETLNKISNNEPKKEEYAASADYKADHEKWQNNKKAAGAFMSKIGELIESARKSFAQKAQSETLNNVPEIVFRSPVGGEFTPENVSDLPERLRDQKLEGFNEVEHSILAELGAWLTKFEADVGSPPERDTFQDKSEHQEALNAYKNERAKGESFFTKLLQLLRGERARRSAADPVYKPVKIAWKTPLGEWGEV